jgi:hypothetical protein
MKRKYFLTSDDKGNFFLNGRNISNWWYDFFAGLTMEQEKDCAKIFIRRYAKKLL